MSFEEVEMEAGLDWIASLDWRRAALLTREVEAARSAEPSSVYVVLIFSTCVRLNERRRRLERKWRGRGATLEARSSNINIVCMCTCVRERFMYCTVHKLLLVE